MIEQIRKKDRQRPVMMKSKITKKVNTSYNKLNVKFSIPGSKGIAPMTGILVNIRL